MSGINSMVVLQRFINANHLSEVNSFDANVAIMKAGKLIHNSKRKVFIQRNSYGGWGIQPDEIRHIVGHECFNTNFQEMNSDGKTLTVYSDGYEINIGL